MSTNLLDRDVLRPAEGDPRLPAYHPGHSLEHRPEHQSPRNRTGSHRIPVARQRPRPQLLTRTASAAGWILGLFGVVLALLHVLVGAGAFVELSDSMSPHYRAGDLVLTRLKSPDALSVGDVIAVVPPGHSVRVAHRIVAISGPPDSPVLTTRGDANPTVDAWRVTPRSDVSVAVADIPGGGRAVMLIHSDLLRAVFVLLLGFGLTAVLLRRMMPAPNCPPDCAQHPGHARSHIPSNQTDSSTDQENE